MGIARAKACCWNCLQIVVIQSDLVGLVCSLSRSRASLWEVPGACRGPRCVCVGDCLELVVIQGESMRVAWSLSSSSASLWASPYGSDNRKESSIRCLHRDRLMIRHPTSHQPSAQPATQSPSRPAKRPPSHPATRLPTHPDPRNLNHKHPGHTRCFQTPPGSRASDSANSEAI